MARWRRLTALVSALVLVFTMVVPLGATAVTSRGSLNYKWQLPGKPWQPTIHPIDIATNAAGTAYVADEGGYVSVFSAGGELIKTFGAGTQSEDDSRTLDDPHGITVDTTGTVWVADNDREAIFHYSATGELISVINDDRMCEPEAVAVDGDGHVYVADSCEGDVFVYDENGDYLTGWSSWESEVSGSLCTPSGIAIDDEGNVWVAEGCSSEDYILLKFDKDGNWLNSVGDRDWEEFGEAGRLHFAADGTAWVAEVDCDDIWRFDVTEGVAIEPYNYNDDFDYPHAATPGPNGALWVADTDNWRIWHGTLSERILELAGTSALSVAGAPMKTASVTPPKGAHEPAPEACDKGVASKHPAKLSAAADPARDLRVATTSNVIAPPVPLRLSFDYDLRSWDYDEPWLNEPKGVAVGSNGKVWVSNYYNGTMDMTDSDGATLTVKASGEIQPWGVAVAATGTVIVGDSGGNRFIRFAPDGTYESSFGEWGTDPGQFDGVHGVAVDSANNVYVVDRNNNRIQKVTPAGVATVVDTEVSGPIDVAVGPDDSVYVSDSWNSRIKKYSPSGSVVATWGTGGNGPMQFEMPMGLGVDSAGRVYVADNGNKRICVFDKDGGLIGNYGTPGPGPGQFTDVYDVAADANGGVYVVESDLSRLQKFELKLLEPERVGGPDRYVVAADSAEASFPGWAGVKHIVIASGEERAAADPMVAAGLCGVYDAPLLLTKGPEALPVSTIAAFKAIAAANSGTITVHVVGGIGSVPISILNKLSKLAPGRFVFDRIKANGDRYELAGAVAKRMQFVLGAAMPKTVFVTNGAAMYDTLAASPVARFKHYPVLLTGRDALPEATKSALAALGAKTRYVVGGSASVSENVRRELRAPSAWRIWGADRYATATAFADRALAEGWSNGAAVGISAAPADSASAASNVGKAGGVVLFTARASLSAPSETWLKGHASGITSLVVFGGPASVSPATFSAIENAVK